MYNTLQESLDDVGSELHEMRNELHKLMGVIESKDHAIETLENQLRTSKDQIKVKLVLRDYFFVKSTCSEQDIVVTNALH